MKRSYLPNTEADRAEMLGVIGVSSIQELFDYIPAQLRCCQELDLPQALSEPELVRHMRELADKNADLQHNTCFLGAGAYDHYLPSVVDHVVRRSEFYTAYTQYQPELAQGYLQVLWEYQSMICELTGMAAANASLYDGGSALAEAAMLSCGATGRRTIVIGKNLHPHYRRIVKTYGLDWGYEVVEIDYSNGLTDLKSLTAKINKDTAAVIVQNPNFFGAIENVNPIADIAHAAGAYLVVMADPISLGLLAAPGSYQADIVVGEGQPLGLPISFGGPYLGFFATTQKLMRKMPGRIVGQTTDVRGQRGFVLTLQAREQHIRREKATSNICSNEALCALSAAVYLSAVGKGGLKQIAEACIQKSHYAWEKITALPGCEGVHTAPFFKEFVVRFNRPVVDINKALLAEKIIGGLDLGQYYEDMENCMLLCVTEKRTRAEIDKLVERLGAIL